MSAGINLEFRENRAGKGYLHLLMKEGMGVGRGQELFLPLLNPPLLRIQARNTLKGCEDTGNHINCKDYNPARQYNKVNMFKIPRIFAK